jgi:serine kinase of HPr protein (carbohydrate metabolism regulator)
VTSIKKLYRRNVDVMALQSRAIHFIVWPAARIQIFGAGEVSFFAKLLSDHAALM